MRVLVIGASGFIGRAVVARLIRGGQTVTCAGRDAEALRRRFPGLLVLRMDWTAHQLDWVPHLAGMDAAVNASGALRGDLQRVQADGPIALFRACAAVGVRSVVQISALGAGSFPDSPFLATKAQADAVVLHKAETRPGWHVVRPSVVIGRGGASTALFTTLACLPIAPGFPGVLQPIHLDDLAALVCSLLAGDGAPALVEAAGPEPLSVPELVAMLRTWLGLPPAVLVPLPAGLLRSAAGIGERVPGSPLTRETLALLSAGTVARPGAARSRPLAEALAADLAQPTDRLAASMRLLRPIGIAALGAVWVGTGVVSLGVPAGQAARLLPGLPAPRALTLLGAVVDLALGAALFVPRWRRTALWLQLAVMAAYTAVASLLLPGLWGDPFGPLLKNAAVLAATLFVLAAEA